MPLNYIQCYAHHFMETIIKVLLTQIAILVCWYLCMHPSTPIANYMEKIFKDYKKALNITTIPQVIGIIATLMYCLWIA